VGRHIPHPSRLGLAPTLLPVQCVKYPGDKADGAWVQRPIKSRTDVKERVELYLYSPYRLSRPVLELILALCGGKLLGVKH
jgi:hypothetical protein